jgi:hypothetical protein
MASQGSPLPTWTTSPSLLHLLEPEEHRQALEAAVCAHQCGRFNEARDIFETQLPPSHTSFIITLERSDMLSSQGLEHERVKLLRSALQSLDLDEATGQRILIELLLADAEYWAFGMLQQAYAKALNAARWIRVYKSNNWTEVEVQYCLPL